jgi:hypothetical protein
MITSTKGREQNKMNNLNYNKRINLALRQHNELLSKELSYSEDLQNQEVIARHRANIAKVEGMLK